MTKDDDLYADASVAMIDVLDDADALDALALDGRDTSGGTDPALAALAALRHLVDQQSDELAEPRTALVAVPAPDGGRSVARGLVVAAVLGGVLSLGGVAAAVTGQWRPIDVVEQVLGINDDEAKDEAPDEGAQIPTTTASPRHAVSPRARAAPASGQIGAGSDLPRHWTDARTQAMPALPTEPRGPGDQPPANDVPWFDGPAVEEPVWQDPSIEEPPADEPVEEPPVEEPPAEEPPAEDPPAEDPPAEDPPAEDPPAEDPPVDELAVNEPGEKPPANNVELPAEDA